MIPRKPRKLKTYVILRRPSQDMRDTPIRYTVQAYTGPEATRQVKAIIAAEKAKA